MSGASRPAAASSTNVQAGIGEKSFFEQQRELLLKEIGVVCSVTLGVAVDWKWKQELIVTELEL
jgi:hypothetical protein